MSDDKRYTNRDVDQFAALTPSGSGKQASAKRIVRAPKIRTRTSYSDKDLEKYQKMFSSGFVPEAEREPGKPVRLSSNTTTEINTSKAYSAEDERQFGRLALGGAARKASGAARKASIEPPKGGRVERRATATTYSAQDLEQFEGLAARVGEPAKTGVRTNTRPGAADRKLRFSDLNETSVTTSSSASRTSRIGQSGLKRPGEGRIKLRYFD